MAHPHDRRTELTTIRRVLQVVDKIKLFPYKNIHASVAHSYCYPWPATVVRHRLRGYTGKKEASVNRKLKQTIQRSETNILIFHRFDLWVQVCPAWNNSVIQHIQLLHWGDVTWVTIAQNQFFPSLNKTEGQLFSFFLPTPPPRTNQQASD